MIATIMRSLPWGRLIGLADNSSYSTRLYLMLYGLHKRKYYTIGLSDILPEIFLRTLHFAKISPLGENPV